MDHLQSVSHTRPSSEAYCSYDLSLHYIHPNDEDWNKSSKQHLRVKISMQKWAKLLCGCVYFWLLPPLLKVDNRSNWKLRSRTAAPKLNGNDLYHTRTWAKKCNWLLGQLAWFFLLSLHFLWHFLLCILSFSTTIEHDLDSWATRAWIFYPGIMVGTF